MEQLSDHSIRVNQEEYAKSIMPAKFNHSLADEVTATEKQVRD